jgi:hypothetical protein
MKDESHGKEYDSVFGSVDPVLNFLRKKIDLKVGMPLTVISLNAGLQRLVG